MSNYKNLKISSFIGHNIIVGLINGKYLKGILDIDLINEDWREDGEREELGLLIDDKIEGVYLDEIEFIIKTNDVSCVKKNESA